MKKILMHGGAVLFLLAAVLAVFWFNHSSASRTTITEDNSPSGNEMETVVEPTPDQNPTVKDPTVEPTDPDVLEKEAFDAFLADLETMADASDKGYTAQLRYGEDSVLVYSKLGGFAKTLTPDQVEMLRVVYKHTAVSSLPYSELAIEKVSSLMLYGGLVIAHSEEKQYILDPVSGEIECDATGYYPSYEKDTEGRAIFQREENYYYFDGTINAFVQTEQPPYRGLYFDCAPEYGMPYKFTPYYDAEIGKWGYLNENGEVAIEPIYHRAYAFNDNGVAIVQKTKLDGLLFIDIDGNVLLDTHLEYYDYIGNVSYDWFRSLPDLTVSSVGALYFDHGYTRVIIETFSLRDSAELTRTREALVDVNGNLFSLPGDYSIVAYSDGVVLLEKNGKYGYYSYEGKWIVDPIYASATAFAGGVGVAMDENGKYHAFDINGNEIIPGVFDYLSPVSAGKMLGYREGEGWMLLSICG